MCVCVYTNAGISVGMYVCMYVGVHLCVVGGGVGVSGHTYRFPPSNTCTVQSAAVECSISDYIKGTSEGTTLGNRNERTSPPLTRRLLLF